MKKITFDDALAYTSPHAVALVSSLTPEGGTNLAAVCWWTFLESEPAMIGFSMANESYTCELVKGARKAVLSIPGESISVEAFQCGMVSGRDVNKAEKLGIHLKGGHLKYPVDSKVVFVCTLENPVPVGECTFFICSIDEILYNENERHIYAWHGSDKLAAIP